MGKNRVSGKPRLLWTLALALALMALSPLAGFMSTAQAEVKVSAGDHSGYALYGERSAKSLTFTISGLERMASLQSAAVVSAQGQAMARSLTNRDYTYDSRNAALTIHNQEGFLSGLALGRYLLKMKFAPGGEVWATFYVYEKDTIQILTDPLTVVTNIGDDVTFECLASATGSMTYQWQRRSRTGWKDIKGATGRYMTISSVPESLQGYVFRCVAATSFASATSAEAKLYMIGAGDGAPLWLYFSSMVLAAGGLLVSWRWHRKRAGAHHSSL